MSWTSQVWHVFQKDVRASRWLLIAYAALLLLGVAEVAADVDLSTPGWALSSLTLRSLAVVICTLIVLADAPFNPRSHWASLPYARSAVLAAKAVMVCMLLLCTALALLGALHAFEVPLGEAFRPAIISIVGLFALLLATALIASVERTFVAVVVMVVLAFPALLLLGLLAYVTATTAFGAASVPGWVGVAALLIAVAAVLPLVRARRVHTALRVGVFYAAVVLVGVQFISTSGYAYAESAPAPGVSATAELSQHAGGRTQFDHTLNVSVRLQGASPSQRVDWIESRVRLSSKDAAAREQTMSSSWSLNNPALPLPPNLTWLGAYPKQDAGEIGTDSTRLRRAPMQVFLRRLPRDGGADVLTVINDSSFANVTDIVVQGSVELREPRVFGRLPLTTNAQLMRHGRRITVLNAAFKPHPEVRLDFESVLTDGREDLKHYTFVLVNSRRSEAVRLVPMESAHSSGSWLLAPSISRRVNGVLRPTYGLTPFDWEQLGMTDVQFAGSWLQDAELVIIEWELVGSIPIEARTRIDRD